MTEPTTNIKEEKKSESFKKLSIQVSLNGLSFCVLDTLNNQIVKKEHLRFKSQQTPYALQKELKGLIEKHKLRSEQFMEVKVVHRNKLFSLVPTPLFDENELANYLKFNAKILATDHIVYDELSNHEMVNVYVPYTNINNYVFELFGEFEFKHNATVFLETFLSQKFDAEPHCIVHVYHNQMELLVLSQKKMQLYNQFDFTTKEDFLYYLLFTFEQLSLDTEEVKLKLFGTIEENDALFNICYKYIKDVSVIIPPIPEYSIEDSETIDFTILNTF